MAHRNEKGHSLIELMIVILIIGAVAAIVAPQLKGRNDGPRLISEAAARIKLRRREARLLAPQTAATVFLDKTQVPIIFDFRRLVYSGPLRIEGTDANGDGIDDLRGVPLTRINPNTGQWILKTEGAGFHVPSGWNLVYGPNPQLPAGAGLIKNGAGEVMGIPASAIGFDAEGNAWADQDGDGKTESGPQTLVNTTPSKEAPFWAVYYTNGSAAVALSVHATGYTEIWRWDPSDGWQGWKNRTPEN